MPEENLVDRSSGVWSQLGYFLALFPHLHSGIRALGTPGKYERNNCITHNMLPLYKIVSMREYLCSCASLVETEKSEKYFDIFSFFRSCKARKSGTKLWNGKVKSEAKSLLWLSLLRSLLRPQIGLSFARHVTMKKQGKLYQTGYWHLVSRLSFIVSTRVRTPAVAYEKVCAHQIEQMSFLKVLQFLPTVRS